MNHAQLIAKELHTDITDEIVIQAVNKEIKQLNQTMEALQNKTDSDLYKSTRNKKSIIKVYLPRMMDKSEIRRFIYTVIGELGINEPLKSDKGRIMKVLMPRVQGKADGKKVNAILDSILK